MLGQWSYGGQGAGSLFFDSEMPAAVRWGKGGFQWRRRGLSRQPLLPAAETNVATAGKASCVLS
jgi:hypothetical protein